MVSIIYTTLAAVVLLSALWYFSTHFPCPIWLSKFVEMDNPFTKTNHSKTIIDLLNLKNDTKIVDAGCGPGRVTIPLAKKVGLYGEVVAMDLQEGMLERVQQKAIAENIHNIRFLNAGLGTGKLEHSYYDYALLVSVLGEIPDKHAALRELFVALKPGGILSITEVIFDPHFKLQSTVINLARPLGFKIKNIYGGRFAYTMHLEKL